MSHTAGHRKKWHSRIDWNLVEKAMGPLGFFHGGSQLYASMFERVSSKDTPTCTLHHCLMCRVSSE